MTSVTKAVINSVDVPQDAASFDLKRDKAVRSGVFSSVNNYRAIKRINDSVGENERQIVDPSVRKITPNADLVIGILGGQKDDILAALQDGEGLPPARLEALVYILDDPKLLEPLTKAGQLPKDPVAQVGPAINYGSLSIFKAFEEQKKIDVHRKVLYEYHRSTHILESVSFTGTSATWDWVDAEISSFRKSQKSENNNTFVGSLLDIAVSLEAMEIVKYLVGRKDLGESSLFGMSNKVSYWILTGTFGAALLTKNEELALFLLDHGYNTEWSPLHDSLGIDFEAYGTYGSAVKETFAEAAAELKLTKVLNRL